LVLATVLIELTDEDERLSRKVERFIAQFPKLMESLSDTAAVDMLAALKRQWREESALQRAK
jgi:hypothetical protein